MTINVTNAQANYKASAGNASIKYKQKVLANTNWQQNASSPASEANWSAAVSAAAASQRRAKKVALVGQGDWQQRASTVGAPNLTTGITNGDSKWAKGFAPYAPIIDNAVATLPPRGIGIATNIQRVLKIGQALEDAKKAQG
jgi:hypothetical protein